MIYFSASFSNSRERLREIQRLIRKRREMSPILPGMAARRILPKYHTWMADRRSLIAHRVFSAKVKAKWKREFHRILKPDSA